MTSPARGWLSWLLVTAFVLAGGCSPFPTDPDGTLDRVRGGVLRVGVSPHSPWTVVSEGSDPAGIEPDLVEEFAGRLQARVEWRVGGEEMLITELDEGSLDLVIGGLTADSPWSDKASLTKPYTDAPDATGKPVGRVMAALMGENAFLLELEEFLLSEARR